MPDVTLLPVGRLAAFLLALAGSLAAGAVAVPALRRLHLGQQERADGPASHLAKAGTPTMGGVIFLVPVAAAILLLRALGAGNREATASLLATLGFALVGAADDALKVARKGQGGKGGLTPLQKSLGLLLVSCAYALYRVLWSGAAAPTEVLLPLTGMGRGVALPAAAYFVFTVFVFYATTNAVNLTDGVDGLAATVTLAVMAAFAVIAAAAPAAAGGAGAGAPADGVALFAAAVAGGCLGFLFFNHHPAKVIMGDMGSLALGGAVTCAATALRLHWAILLLGCVYVAEIGSVFVQVAWYKRTKRRVFKMAPLHHHFELSGWKETRVVAAFAAATALGCLAGAALALARAF